MYLTALFMAMALLFGSHTVTFTVPAVQTVSETGEMDHNSATSSLSFSVGKEGPYVSSVILKSLSGKNLSGKARARIDAAGNIKTTPAGKGRADVVLRSFDGECPLNEGTYYLAFIPGTYGAGDLELTINYTNGKSAVDTLSKVSALMAGEVFEFGAIPEYVVPDAPVKPDGPVDPERIMDEYDVYLLIGQSNMAGRGTLADADRTEVIDGVFLLGPDDTPVPATNPFNQYSTIKKSGSTLQRMNPGYAFSKTVYAYEKTRPILIVCNARGGTAISEWAKGENYYNEAVRRAKEAMRYGTLKGILWHQGCSDSGKPESYMPKLVQLVADLRADLGMGDIPFVAGELAWWRSSSPKFNEMLHTISANIPNSDWVSAEDCGPLKPESLDTASPDPHFSREGQILLGTRYAEKIIEMVYP